MRTCHLHFGMPKTGSTAIQEALHRHSEATIEYARLSTPNHGLQLITAFAEDPASFYMLRNRAAKPKEAHDIAATSRAEITKAIKGRKSVIFSAEAVPDHMSPDEIAALVAFMKASFDRVSVIMYLRPPASLVSSQFQERIKSGLGKFLLPAPDYRKRMSPLIEACGRDGITFVQYSRNSLRDNDVVADFCARVGVSPATKDIAAGTADPSNSSLSAEAIARIFSFNKYVAPHLPIRQRTNVRNALKTRLVGLGDAPFRLSSGRIERHLKKHAEDIEWASHVSGIDLSAPETTPENGISSESDLLAYLDQPLPPATKETRT
ncbi:hypothetical protein [Paracoccus sp. R86501]|uniref:hypothetical protein n=1 Tax=Paracoccus sp. R86501 TaxID=3101711 RepID=UPI00366EE1F7